MQPFSYQHLEQYISKRKYIKKTVVILCLYTYISGLDLQRCSLELLLPLLKYISGISEWGLANSFRNHVIHSLFRVMNFHDIHILPTVKSKNLLYRRQNMIRLCKHHTTASTSVCFLKISGISILFTFRIVFLLI